MDTPAVPPVARWPACPSGGRLRPPGGPDLRGTTARAGLWSESRGTAPSGDDALHHTHINPHRPARPRLPRPPPPQPGRWEGVSRQRRLTRAPPLESPVATHPGVLAGGGAVAGLARPRRDQTLTNRRSRPARPPQSPRSAPAAPAHPTTRRAAPQCCDRRPRGHSRARDGVWRPRQPRGAVSRQKVLSSVPSPPRARVRHPQAPPRTSRRTPGSPPAVGVITRMDATPPPTRRSAGGDSNCSPLEHPMQRDQTT